LSAAILLALYGDWPFNACRSVIGSVSGVPYTSLVEVCTSRAQPCRRTASSTLSVPRTLVSTNDSGAR
jgi:hypothetical protein